MTKTVSGTRQTDNNGATVGTATYDPYGHITSTTGVTSPLGYDGQYTDPETGLIYLRARYYDPATAQFLTRDPLDVVTRSAYGYVDDNPLNGSDPTRLFCIFSNSNGCVGLGKIVHDEAHAAGSLLHQLVPGVPSYLNVCIGGGYIVGGEACIERTRGGQWYLTPAVGLTNNPGLIASFQGGSARL